MSTQTLDRTDTEITDELDPTTGEPRCRHLIAPRGDKTGGDLVMEAAINGTPLEALCGHVFVPTRDPKRYPLCPKCKEIREAERPDQDPYEIN